MRLTLNEYLWVLSGDDYRIIRKCKKSVQHTFAGIGAVVAVIALLCFIGSYYTFYKVFSSVILGIMLGVFFAWMITNIYLLILYTLSKDVLPHKPSTGGRLFSKGIRLGFVIFIAVIVAKPIELVVLYQKVLPEIAAYKAEKLAKYTALTDEHYQAEIVKYEIEIKKALNNPDSIYIDQIQYYKKLIAYRLSERDRLIAEMEKKISRSKFYIKSLQILNSEFPATWVATIIVVALFLLPFILKSFIPENNEYYILNKGVQMKIVTDHFSAFKKEYSYALSPLTEFNGGNYFAFSEPYIDPPFNTIRKSESPAESESSLKNFLYHG
ncbi:DUF4407 domain-containing protein [Pontibacter chinhatensis]|uniref:DUF4407 domain-containing protein n=1 Tax=Pontibacter chinhatensis TaxID=1436961 RepID=A0A1I2QLB6_9BACT|nr:DUF4407 domain-containing protein [Pontibacter chinhatensis]SFG29232.1 protein of unknown function [Pontibacter chinhatensis]